MASLKGSNNRVIEDDEPEASSHGEATSNFQPNSQNEILEQLIPTLVAM